MQYHYEKLVKACVKILTAVADLPTAYMHMTPRTLTHVNSLILCTEISRFRKLVYNQCF